MKDKIGIVTFHRGFSYGAVLQAYALQNFMFKNNIDNEIIDYRCQYMINHYQKVFRKITGNKIKGFIWNLLMAKDIIKSRKAYPVFAEKYLKMSQSYNTETIEKAKGKYKKFIVGSDQVWSPECVGFDPVYFLNFADSKQKYSYGASIAKRVLPKELEEEYKKRLGDFQSFSLRETSGKSIVENLLNVEAQVHIDPTFLLEKTDWDTITTERKNQEPYIFLFTVLKPIKLVEYALELSKKTGYKVIYLNNQNPKKIKGINYIDVVMPNEFISLIKNAEYVCTNSFHGTSFSMIYEKNFVAEIKTGRGDNIRSKEVMEKTGLEKRILENANFDINSATDWSRVRSYIEKERERSGEYLVSIK